ncbi:hypothetical protein [Athalassotoga saccharophila]|uniref:hypothetical protein n=1 Tax=Athalassotoga saccharophila TaxID=1441386 RepID=UPI00137AF908|nr:hypothetical protein [Athalassotoga saccharophila]BBJ27990.1 predicted alpha-ribazole-5-phosphate synthase CblS [Athalassotoga saccharophila]
MRRDANLIRFKDGFLIHACDSAGGIGSLENDLLNVPVEMTVKYTLRTALMEVISLGGEALSTSFEFANAPEYAQMALNGVKDILEKFSLPYVVSTEKNFKTSQSGIGVSVVGFTKNPIIGRALAGTAVFVAGVPLVGEELLKNEDKVLTFEEFLKIRSSPYVGEIVPVGSNGVYEEAKLLASNSGLNLKLEVDEEWLYKSGGPSTSIVFWANKIIDKAIRIGVLENE